jgi:hypothetical protein
LLPPAAKADVLNVATRVVQLKTRETKKAGSMQEHS